MNNSDDCTRQYEIAFKVCDTGLLFTGSIGSRPVISAEYDGCILSVSLLFDTHAEPLRLRGSASLGDDVRLILLPYRLELRIHGQIADEEWPDCVPDYALLCFGGQCMPSFHASVLTQPVPPDILGSFTDAEGWRPFPDVYVGDCMPYVFEDRFHVLYLKDRHHHKSKWGKGAHQWEHISTGDLYHWDIHPMAVPITDPKEGSICTGSWICLNGLHYLYYTVRTADGSPAPLCRSVSPDGYHFTKDRDFKLFFSPRYRGVSARDPKVIRDESGSLHMFVTTTDMRTGHGALAHLISGDGENWHEEDSIYESPDGDEPECSDYFRFGRYYYLIFSHRGMARYRYSEKPFGDWIIPADPIIPCASVPKAAVFNGRALFAGFNRLGGYGGTMTFREAIQQSDGSLTFIPLK